MSIDTAHVRESDSLISTARAAARLGINVRTIWRLASQGHLHVVHIGRAARIRVSDIDRLVAKGTRAPGIAPPLSNPRSHRTPH